MSKDAIYGPGTKWATTGHCAKHSKFFSVPEGRCEECFAELKLAVPLDITSKGEDFTRMREQLSGISSTDRGPVMSARYNEGKVQTREIDPNFILGIGEVLTKSRAKYDHFNWCKPTKLSTPYESMMRHILAFQKGEDFDKETGSHHLLHVATNLMFMYYHITNNPEESDDRFFKKDKK